MTLRWVPGWNGLTEPEAVSYVAAVEAADGQELEFGVARAINDFVAGCKQDGIWDAIKASCILAGARTLDGALVPLVGAAPTNNNFVSGDYNRETGLVGDGSTKYLTSNRNNNADTQNNQHCSIYVSTAATGSGSGHGYIGAGDIGAGTTNISTYAPDIYIRSQNSAAQNVGPISANGLIGLSRSTNSEYSSRVSNTTSNQSISTQTPNNLPFTVFSLGSGYYADGRLAFYSIGESLDLAALDTRVSNLITAIGAAIP